MNTCKYCGSELKNRKDELFECDYCEMKFSPTDICKDRKRKEPIPFLYDLNYYRPTKELLAENTLILFHILKDCRKDWFQLFSSLQKFMKLKEGDLPEDKQEELNTSLKPLYNEYIKLTKQKFIIENILLEKAGFLPEKITTEFLNELIEQSVNASKKNMYIYIKKA